MSNVTGTFTASNAFVGYGAEFKVGQGDSPETFVSVPMVNKITMGDLTTGVVDVTHLRSPSRHREKRGTIRDSGAIQLECDYDPTHGAHQISGGDGFLAGRSLVALSQNVTEANFRILFPAAAGSIFIDIVGTVTKYAIGELGVETPTKVMVEITPLRDYSSGFPA